MASAQLCWPTTRKSVKSRRLRSTIWTRTSPHWLLIVSNSTASSVLLKMRFPISPMHLPRRPTFEAGGFSFLTVDLIDPVHDRFRFDRCAFEGKVWKVLRGSSGLRWFPRIHQLRSSEIEELPAVMREILSQHNLHVCTRRVSWKFCFTASACSERARDVSCTSSNGSVHVLVAFRALSRPVWSSVCLLKLVKIYNGNMTQAHVIAHKRTEWQKEPSTEWKKEQLSHSCKAD